jgi:hypothetical protein
MFTSRIKGGDRRYPVPANSANAAANSAAVATGYGTLHRIAGWSPLAQYIQIHDAAVLPADGVNCLLTLPVLANNWFDWYFGVDGLPFHFGLQLCNSSTDIAKTIGLADTQFVCTYRLKGS